jgi:hypothetical protein
MATAKVSLTLEEELVEEARGAVGVRGLSGYVNNALRQQLQRDRVLRLLADLEREHGPIGPKTLAEVRKEWSASGRRGGQRRPHRSPSRNG